MRAIDVGEDVLPPREVSPVEGAVRESPADERRLLMQCGQRCFSGDSTDVRLVTGIATSPDIGHACDSHPVIRCGERRAVWVEVLLRHVASSAYPRDEQLDEEVALHGTFPAACEELEQPGKIGNRVMDERGCIEDDDSSYFLRVSCRPSHANGTTPVMEDGDDVVR